MNSDRRPHVSLRIYRALPAVAFLLLYRGPLTAQNSITVSRAVSGTVAANTMIQITPSGVATCATGPCDGVALSAASAGQVQVALSGTVEIMSTSSTATVGDVAILSGSSGYVADSGLTDPSSGALSGAAVVGKILASGASPNNFTVQLFGPGTYSSRVQTGTALPACPSPGLIFALLNSGSTAAELYTSNGTGASCSWLSGGLGVLPTATPANTQIATFQVSGGLGLTNSAVTADTVGNVNGNGTANFLTVKSTNTSARGAVYLNSAGGTGSVELTPVSDPGAMTMVFMIPDVNDIAAGLGVNGTTQNMAGTTYGSNTAGGTFIPNLSTSVGSGTATASNGLLITPGGSTVNPTLVCQLSGSSPDAVCAVTIAGSGRPTAVSGNGTSVNVAQTLLASAGGNTNGTTGQTAGSGGDVVVQAGSGGSAGGTSTAGNGGNVDLVMGNQGGGGGNLGARGQLKVALATATTPSLVYGISYQGLPELAVGASVSGATISPVSPITHVTASTPVSTITAPVLCSTSGFGCQITLIADVAFMTTLGGNIKVGSSVAINKALVLTYDSGYWYPIY